jgi:hypothetical protein
MLSLPAEITSNKNLVGIKPIIFIDFFDRAFFVASKDYTMQMCQYAHGSLSSFTFTDVHAHFITDGVQTGDYVILESGGWSQRVIANVLSETQLTVAPSGTFTDVPYHINRIYLDLLDKNSGITAQTSLSEACASIGSVGNFNVTLLDWEGTVRSYLLGYVPSLTGATVDVYIKFDTDNNYRSNAVKIFSGSISDYKVKQNKITLTIKPLRIALSNIPTSLLKNSYSYTNLDSQTAKPLQFGDFNMDEDIFSWGLNTGYAICPYCGKDNYGRYIFYIACHEMNELATSTDYADSTYYNPHMMGCINDVYFRLHPTTYVQTNAAGGSLITVETFTWNSNWIYLHFHEANAANTCASWANACDGNIATYANVVDHTSSPTYPLWIRVLNTYQLLDNPLFASTAPTYYGDRYRLRCFVKLGSITISYMTVTLQVCDHLGFVYASQVITAGDANTTVTLSKDVVTLPYLSLMDNDSGTNSDIQFRIKMEGVAGTGDATVQVKEIMFAITNWANPYDAEDFDAYLNTYPYVVIKAKGREYSSTWSSRKTAGNLIENPADMIESILRDDLATTSIDTASFDVLNAIYSTNVKIACSIYNQRDGVTLLNNICKAFNIGMNLNIQSKWKIFLPVATGNNFASSGTGTPGNEDIFNQVDIITNNIYTQHQIKRDSPQLDRTDENEYYAGIILNYRNIWNTLVSQYTTGSGKLKTIDNEFISDITSITNLASIIDNFLYHQHFLITIDSFYNALAHELGDVANIRHSMLSDDLIDATVNTQKWMILNWIFKWHPAVISLKAIELF